MAGAGSSDQPPKLQASQLTLARPFAICYIVPNRGGLMARDATEHEMIERLIDGTRTAADRVAEMCRTLASGLILSPHVLVQARHSLRQASGCSHQLGHAQQNPAFFTVRDQLDEISTNLMTAATLHPARSGYVLALLGGALDRLWREAQAMATSRAVPRADVLAALDVRQKALVN